MADIELEHVNAARNAALQLILNTTYINSELEFLALCVVFAQLINSVVYKVSGKYCRLTYTILKGMCKDNRIKLLFNFRLIAAHLYGTEKYKCMLNDLYDIFGYDNFYYEILIFMREVAISIEDDSFESKYGIPKKQSSLLSLAKAAGNRYLE